MKIGDKVRFLSEVGGGIVTGFQRKDFGSNSGYFRRILPAKGRYPEFPVYELNHRHWKS